MTRILAAWVVLGSAVASAHSLEVNQGRLQVRDALVTLTFAPGEAVPPGTAEETCAIVEAGVGLSSAEGRPERLACELVSHHGHHDTPLRLVVMQYRWPNTPSDLRLTYDLFSGQPEEQMSLLAVRGRQQQVLTFRPDRTEVAVFSEEALR